MKHLAFKFLTRPGCHLCDEARPLVEQAILRRGGTLEEVDIDTDDSLIRDYGMRIPVLLGPDEMVIAEGQIGRASLRRALRRV